jgi:hypothetical protein
MVNVFHWYIREKLLWLTWVLNDLLAVVAAVEEELVPEAAGAVVGEVVVEAAAAEFVTVALPAVAVEVTDSVSVSDPVVVAEAALGPAYLVQKPSASLLLAVSREKRYGWAEDPDAQQEVAALSQTDGT